MKASDAQPGCTLGASWLASRGASCGGGEDRVGSVWTLHKGEVVVLGIPLETRLQKRRAAAELAAAELAAAAKAAAELAASERSAAPLQVRGIETFDIAG